MSEFDSSAGHSSISRSVQSGATAGLNKSDAVTSQRQSSYTRGIPKASSAFSSNAGLVNNITYKNAGSADSILVKFLYGAMNTPPEPEDCYIA